MYAIIRAGGHQEKVSAGDQITLDRLHKDVGSTIEFMPLVVGDDDGNVVSDKTQLEGTAMVLGTVVEHVKGPKVEVFQYRQKTNYRRHVGHRQPLTLVEIAEIRLGDKVVKADEAKAARADAEAKAREEREKAAEERRTEREAAKKAKAAARKPARKPAAKKAAARKPARKTAAKKKK